MEKQEYDLHSLITYLERESGLREETVVSAIEDALKTAVRKNRDITADFRINIDRKDMKVRAYDTLVVSSTRTGAGFMSPQKAFRLTGRHLSEGEVAEVEVPVSSLGRVVAVVAHSEAD